MNSHESPQDLALQSRLGIESALGLIVCSQTCLECQHHISVSQLGMVSLESGTMEDEMRKRNALNKEPVRTDVSIRYAGDRKYGVGQGSIRGVKMLTTESNSGKSTNEVGNADRMAKP